MDTVLHLPATPALRRTLESLDIAYDDEVDTIHVVVDENEIQQLRDAHVDIRTLLEFTIDSLSYFGGQMEREQAERSAACALICRIDRIAVEQHGMRYRGQKRLMNVLNHLRRSM